MNVSELRNFRILILDTLNSSSLRKDHLLIVKKREIVSRTFRKEETIFQKKSGNGYI